MPNLRLSPEVQELLRCPRCQGMLRWAGTEVFCTSPGCGSVYPITDGVPILIDEERSIFDLSDFLKRPETLFRTVPPSLRNTVGRLLPRISGNILAGQNYARMAELLLVDRERARVLVVGGGVLGRGMAALADKPGIDLVETDVAFESRTSLICDAHDLPFVDASFDGVVVQAVLEHVVDPFRCVAEMHRVLKPGGLVYGETPFMQQVHMGPYDFTRFTHLGHRRLFRWFEEIDSGASCGPGMALAWAWQYFLLSFATGRVTRLILRGVAALTAFPLKYFDYLLVRRPGGIDAASGVYFLGRKSEVPLSDRALVRGYRGAHPGWVEST